MSGLTLKVLLQDIKKLETEALIVGFFEDVRPLKNIAGELDWLLCGSLSDLIIRHKLRGTVGDVGLLTSRGKVPAGKIFMVGLGSRKEATVQSIRKAAGAAVTSIVNAGVKDAALEFVPVFPMPLESSLPAFYQGVADGVGSGTAAISVLAPDAALYERMLKLQKEFSAGSATATR